MWSDSHSGHFSPGVRAACVHGIEGCVGRSVDPKAMKIQKTLRPLVSNYRAKSRGRERTSLALRVLLKERKKEQDVPFTWNVWKIRHFVMCTLHMLASLFFFARH